MHPILFTWGGGALYTYTTLFSIAILVGGWLWVREAKRLLPLASTDSLINVLIAIFFSGFFGARLLFILTNLKHYESGLFSYTNLSSGGIVFYGGMIGGLVALLTWCYKHDFSYRTVLNAATPGLTFGHAIGRLGCLAHGCCHGVVCNLPWGVVYRDPHGLARPLDLPLHPTQLYEVIGLVAIGYWALRQNRRDGTRAKTFRNYVLAYGILRFFVEFFRGDTLRGALWGLSTSQWVSLTMIICCLFLDFARPKDHNSAHENRT